MQPSSVSCHSLPLPHRRICSQVLLYSSFGRVLIFANLGGMGGSRGSVTGWSSGGLGSGGGGDHGHKSSSRGKSRKGSESRSRRREDDEGSNASMASGASRKSLVSNVASDISADTYASSVSTR